MMNDREDLVRKRATQRLGKVISLTRPLTVLASPAWRGVEGDIWHVEGTDGSEIYKHYHSDLTDYVDCSFAMRAARRAGQQGIGPKVLEVWPEDGLMAMERLDESWRAGGLHDVSDPQRRSAVIKAKKVFQSGDALGRHVSIFAQIKHLYQRCIEERTPLPLEITAGTVFAFEAEKAISALGFDQRPVHGDGNTSNLMFEESGDVKLLDFDLATDTDPFEDIGCYLWEFYENETDARQGFEEWCGSFDEGLFARAYVYGVLDDLLWGLIGSLMGSTSPRRSLEFSKYAGWRFLRFNQYCLRSQAADILRNMS